MTSALVRPRFAVPVVGLLAVLVGLLVSHGFGLVLVGAGVAVGLGVLLVRSPGWGTGIWLLAVTNTIIGPNLDGFQVHGMFQYYDVLMIALMGAALFTAVGLERTELRRRLPRWLVVVVILFSIWWLIVLLDTRFVAGMQVAPAALYGRDFLFGGWGAVCGAVLLSGSREIRHALNLAIAGAVIYSLAFVPHVVLGVSAGWIIHPSQQGITGGLTRVYALSNDLVTALFPVALLLTVVTHRNARVAYACVSVLFAVQIALQQTRANYVGVGFGLVFVSALIVGRPLSKVLRTRLLVSWLAVGVVMLAMALLITNSTIISSSSGLNGNRIYQRLESIPLALSGAGGIQSGNTWSYREQVAAYLHKTLGHNYLWGLGFLPPKYRYFPGVPGGNLRDVDVGALGTIMAIGVVGLVLLLLPVVGSVLALVRNSSRTSYNPVDLAVSMGLVSFLMGALLSSVTLVTLFWQAGPAMSGIFVACAVSMSRSRAFRSVTPGHELAD